MKQHHPSRLRANPDVAAILLFAFLFAGTPGPGSFHSALFSLARGPERVGRVAASTLERTISHLFLAAEQALSVAAVASCRALEILQPPEE